MSETEIKNQVAVVVQLYSHPKCIRSNQMRKFQIKFN